MQEYEGATPDETVSLHPRFTVDDSAYVGAIPEQYHRGLGPFLFEPFARHTAEVIKVLGPRRVLETACGTGIVTRRMREVLPDGALLVASDLNEPMLAVARNTLGGARHVQWAQADMCKLQFADSEFDAVVCQFGLMFAPDRLAAVREARRVLKRRGALLATTWGSLEDNPIIYAAHRAIASVFPEDPPQYLPRAPFGFGDPEVLMDLLLEGGFGNVVVDVIEKPAIARHARDVAVGLIEGYPLVDEIRLRDASRLPVAIDAVTDAIARQFGERPVRARICALVASGVA
ncbi:MAG: methyltransferase domain-containing protein [Deltaproteobacteria bacterium]|nr:MAG: methyltransferase domain-containing protein [Deltaproteobacteria bacterium]